MMTLKCNSLVDGQFTLKLYEASQAGFRSVSSSGECAPYLASREYRTTLKRSALLIGISSIPAHMSSIIGVSGVFAGLGGLDDPEYRLPG